MTAPFVATHLVPADSLPAWEQPDPTRSPVATLDPGLDVRRVEQREDGWALVVCSNGWSAWVDGRRLVALARGDHAIDAVVDVLNQALEKYVQLANDLAANRVDPETFQREAFKTGLVVRDADAWILDLASKRWWRYDGVQLTTLAFPDTDATVASTGDQR